MCVIIHSFHKFFKDIILQISILLAGNRLETSIFRMKLVFLCVMSVKGGGKKISKLYFLKNELNSSSMQQIMA